MLNWFITIFSCAIISTPIIGCRFRFIFLLPEQPASPSILQYCSRLSLGFRPIASQNRPQLFSNVTDSSALQFCSIIRDQSLTKAQLRQQLTNWSQGENSATQEYLANLTDTASNIRERVQADLQVASQRLSNNARLAVERIIAVENDLNITAFEECQQIAEIFRQQLQSVQAELRITLNEIRRQYPGVDIAPFSPVLKASDGGCSRFLQPIRPRFLPNNTPTIPLRRVPNFVGSQIVPAVNINRRFVS